MTNAERFTEILTSQVNRPGVHELLEWLESTDFFRAPASTKHHGVYEGGLVDHSLNVYYSLIRMHGFIPQESAESVAIVSLLHDVCKAEYYERTEKGWRVNEKLPMGHGEKSVYLVQKHLQLTDEEALAIRWHMGAYDDAFRGGNRALNAAMEKTPLVMMLHYADMLATQEEKCREAR